MAVRSWPNDWLSASPMLPPPGSVGPANRISQRKHGGKRCTFYKNLSGKKKSEPAKKMKLKMWGKTLSWKTCCENSFEKQTILSHRRVEGEKNPATVYSH